MEWFVCKNQTANKEVRLSDSHVHWQGVFCRQDSAGVKAGLMQETEKEQEKAIPQVLMLQKDEHYSAPIQASLFCSCSVTQVHIGAFFPCLAQLLCAVNSRREM